MNEALEDSKEKEHDKRENKEPQPRAGQGNKKSRNSSRPWEKHRNLEQLVTSSSPGASHMHSVCYSSGVWDWLWSSAENSDGLKYMWSHLAHCALLFLRPPGSHNGRALGLWSEEKWEILYQRDTFSAVWEPLLVTEGPENPNPGGQHTWRDCNSHRHALTHRHTLTHNYTYMHSHMFTCINSHTDSHSHTNVYTIYIYSNTHTFAHKLTHLYGLRFTHTYPDTYSHKHTFTQTHAQTL